MNNNTILYKINLYKSNIMLLYIGDVSYYIIINIKIKLCMNILDLKQLNLCNCFIVNKILK